MIKRGRKRNSCNNNENPLPKKINRDEVKLLQKNWMPAAAVEFFQSENYQEVVRNLSIVDVKAVWLGPFRKLEGKSDADGIELIMLDREETDLPEMQTFLKSSCGRYVFWRDRPDDVNPVVVFVDMKIVPELFVVGDKVEHAVFDLCDRLAKSVAMSADRKVASERISQLFDKTMINKEVKNVIKDRQSRTVSGIPGPGVLIDLIPGASIIKHKRKGIVRTGYRDLSKTFHGHSIEKLLRSLRVGTDEQENKIIDLIDTLMAEINICNDEGDLGNGLELGHVLFLANRKSITGKAKIILKIAYNLLNRPDFEKILELSLDLRSHN